MRQELMGSHRNGVPLQLWLLAETQICRKLADEGKPVMNKRA